MAGGQCLFESGSDQILHRQLWLNQGEDEEDNPLMFQEVIDALGDETHSHFEEGRPADMLSDQNLIFVKEIFLEHDYWPFRYEEQGSKLKSREQKRPFHNAFLLCLSLSI